MRALNSVDNWLRMRLATWFILGHEEIQHPDPEMLSQL
ncbi:Protein of unknown function [Pyronema omphalodes CBS 100304]|uniref:Uncharacterized protein n=1 Tax=Pyronema omphalodes (strain CBS 100304) TaxID=1076935 RepID=U4LY69_PYROM|nr:Protein of unknown function [Pyronema omphalodes CBS 100304]